MNMYNVSKGQLISVWFFGMILWFVDSLYILNTSTWGNSTPSFFYHFLLVLIPALLVFYTLGWRKTNNSRSLWFLLKSLWMKIIDLHKWKKNIAKQAQEEKVLVMSSASNIGEKQSPPFLGGLKLLFVLAVFQMILPLAWLPLVSKTNASFAYFCLFSYGLFCFLNIWLALSAFSSLKNSRPNTVALLKMATICLAVAVSIGDILNRVLSNVVGENSANSFKDDGKTIEAFVAFFVICLIYLSVSQRIKNAFPPQERRIYAKEKVIFALIILLPFVMWYGPQIDKKYDLGFISTKQQPWIKYSSPEGGFSVSIPSSPEINKKKIQREDGVTLEQINYFSSSGNSFFGVSTVSYPPEINLQEPSIELKKSLDSMASQKDYELVSSNQLYWHDNFVLDAYVRNKELGGYYKARFLLIDRTSYTLVTSSFTADEATIGADFSKFVDSFELQ